MSEVRIAQSALLDIPAATAYGLIADYRNGHPRILPPRVFPGLDVESGGKVHRIGWEDFKGLRLDG